jgi:hypothetical protein
MAAANPRDMKLRGKLVRLKLLGFFVLLASLQILVGCSSVSLNGSNGGSGGPQLVSIAVTSNAAAIPVGTTDQFTATGSYNNGVQKNITATVTWSSSDTSAATINAAGLATGVTAGKTANIKATMGSITSNTLGLEVDSVQLTSISITPLGIGMLTGGVQQLTATGNFNDGSHQDITSVAGTVFSSSGSSIGVTGSGLVTATSTPGQGTVTVNYSGTLGQSSGSSAINVVDSNYAPSGLSGNYAFSFTSLNSSGPVFTAGSFHAMPPNGSGVGMIDSGTEDINGISGASLDLNLDTALSSYTIFPDGRGILTLVPSGGTPITFRFVLTSSAQVGQIVQFDGAGTGAGSFELQDSNAFNTSALSGNYVFRFNGTDTAHNPLGAVGVFTADGSGNITTGSEVQNDFGASTNFSALSGTIGSVSSNGRATITLSNSNGVFHFVGYVVSANTIQLVGSDSNALVAGVAVLQAQQTFNSADLSGPYAYRLDRVPLENLGRFDVIGRCTFNGLGIVTGGSEYEVDSVSGESLVSSGNYSNMSGLGQTTITITTSNNGNRTYAVYMVSDSQFFMLDTTTSWAGTGAGGSQATSFSNSILTGNYGLTGAEVGPISNPGSNVGVSLWLSFDGAGNLSGIGDAISITYTTQNNGAPIAILAPSSVVLSGTYQSIQSNGQSSFTPPNPSPIVVQSLIFFVVDGSVTEMLGSQPALDGTMFLQ